MPALEPGQAIAYRNRVRIDASRQEHVSFCQAMTVVHDTPEELVVVHRPGEAHWRRNAEHAGPREFRHKPVVRWLNGWTELPAWGTWRRIIIRTQPQRAPFCTAVSLFIVERTNEVDFWYVDIIGPAMRTPWGLDFTEHGLDIVVARDFSSWRWKDEDELAYAVEKGCYSNEEVSALRAEGERAVTDLIARQDSFKKWNDWRPPIDWRLAELPAGWDAL